MHRQVYAALRQRLFYFLGEHALRTNLGKCHFLQPIASRLDDLDFDGVPLTAQPVGDVVGLPESELGTAASNAQIHRRPATLVRVIGTSFEEGLSESAESSTLLLDSGFASRPAMVGNDH